MGTVARAAVFLLLALPGACARAPACRAGGACTGPSLLQVTAHADKTQQRQPGQVTSDGMDLEGGMGTVDDMMCADDIQECDGGDFVRRDPTNGCMFPGCPGGADEDPIMCSTDIRECGGGISVSRDPTNHCEFPACPTKAPPTSEEPTVCIADITDCGGGVTVSRDPSNHCEFPACPTTTAAATTATTSTPASVTASATTATTSMPAATPSMPATSATTVGVLQAGDLVVLRAHTGKYLDVEHHRVLAGSDGTAPSAQFAVERSAGGGPIASGDVVFLRDTSGKYMDVQGDDWKFVRARFAEKRSWQAFTIEKTSGEGPIRSGDSIYLLAHTGKRIDVLCENVHAHASDRGEWQKLVIEKRA